MAAAKRIYAVGDIHGHLDRLREVHEWIEQDRGQHGGDDVVVFVGDLVDRGPDSAGVISWLIDGLAAGQPWVILKGNHDRMMSWYLESPARQDHRLRNDYTWLHPRLGGLTTLASYGVDNPDLSEPERHAAALAAVSVDHRALLAGLETIYCTDYVVLVHAGIRPGLPLEVQIEDDLIWIREPFLSATRSHGPLIIHGHSPVPAVTHYGNRINIDTGVAFGGPLSVVIIERRQVWTLTGAGRTPLLPVR